MEPKATFDRSELAKPPPAHPLQKKVTWRIQMTEVETGITYEAITEDLTFKQHYKVPDPGPIDIMVKAAPKVIATELLIGAAFRLMPLQVKRR